MNEPPSFKAPVGNGPSFGPPHGPSEQPAAQTGPLVEQTPFVSATHAVLFEEEVPTACDVCGEPMPGDDAPGSSQDDEGYAIPGRAFFLSCRGDHPYYEERPLCAGCAAALGMTALARWEIEEEEG